MKLNFFNRKKRADSSLADESREAMLMHKKMNFAAAESYKLLRTDLMFALPDTGRCRIIGVTSSVRNEGKSTTSLNLSYTLAETGKRVLLVDADLRLPSIAAKLDIPGTPGLSNLLVGMGDVESSVRSASDLDTWHILPSGHIPPNPVERLGSQQMAELIARLSESYDFIVIDLPPVNIVSDALAVSPLIDGMIVVVRDGFSERRELHKCIKHLELSNVKVLGFVMTSSEDRNSFYSKYKSNRYYKDSGQGYGSAHRASTDPYSIEDNAND